jgi:hypothetical protein
MKSSRRGQDPRRLQHTHGEPIDVRYHDGMRRERFRNHGGRKRVHFSREKTVLANRHGVRLSSYRGRETPLSC